MSSIMNTDWKLTMFWEQKEKKNPEATSLNQILLMDKI